LRADRFAAVVAVVVASALGLLPAAAHAHFVLTEPASWAVQDTLGNPQKSSPCGQADAQITAVPTNAVTAFQPGQTITVTIDEAVFHPGHYRVVLSTTGPAGLPPDPETTVPGTCMALDIQDPPVYPVLADGMLPHTEPLGGPQSFEVKLPSDVTCDGCTLQVLEFMSAEVGGSGNCFYHHCANLSIAAPSGGGDAGVADAAASTDAGGPGGVDAACGCAIGDGASGAAPLLLLALGGLRRRGRSRR
jgi:MYXO-CTERM domain-containing protein